MANNEVLSDEAKVELLRLKADGVSQVKIAELLGIGKGTVINFLTKKTYKDWWAAHEKPIASGKLRDHRHKIKKLKGKRFILTSAQNNTFVHDKFLGSLETMADLYDAKIIVGTFLYDAKGHKSLQKGQGEGEYWFDPKIKQYIIDEPALLADGLMWCGELNILPTAVNPLSGFHSYTKGSSGIIPHAKVQLESLPRGKGCEDLRMLYTTGAITKQNYIQKKAGQTASFHHVFGALFVEVDKYGDWFVRQLICEEETGTFYDLDIFFTPDGFYENQRAEAVNYGDVHAEKEDKQAYEASFGKSGSMVEVLKPKFQFVHDVLDFDARNSHSIDDPYHRFEKFVNGRESVEDNVDDVCGVLKRMFRPYSKIVVVESNHDLQLKRWLRSSDYKSDPKNAIFFLDCQMRLYKAIRDGNKEFSILEDIVKTKLAYDPGMLQFLKTDESFMICGDKSGGVECGQHGHVGLNGARGSIGSYQKLGRRYNIGHSHSAGIKDGVYQAGVLATMDLGYNIGGTSWSQSNIITYANGKRTIVTIKNGKWRA